MEDPFIRNYVQDLLKNKFKIGGDASAAAGPRRHPRDGRRGPEKPTAPAPPGPHGACPTEDGQVRPRIDVALRASEGRTSGRWGPPG